MARQIRMTPDQMRDRAKDFRDEGQRCEEVIHDLQGLISNLQDEWEGQAAERFTNQFDQLRPSFQRMRDLIDDIAKQLDDTAQTVEQLDIDIAGRFHV